MKKILLIALIIFPMFIYGQDKKEETAPVHDKQAKAILDKTSARYQKHNNVYLYFEYIIKNNQKNITETRYGELYSAKGNKYRLVLPEQYMFCDGNKLYSYDEKSNEMYINYYDPNSQSVLSPEQLLNIYKKGFKYQYRGEIGINSKVRKNGQITKVPKKLYIIDLYPEDPKKSPYSIVRLWIDQNNYEIVSVKYQGKNGIDYFINILETKYDTSMSQKLFTFDKSSLPKDVDIEDFTTED